MSGRPIVGENAETYIKSVANHGIDVDTRWLIDEGEFPIDCRILDVGSGTGKLANLLGTETGVHRTVLGIDLSPELVAHAKKQSIVSNVSFVEGDFLVWHPPTNWRPDALIMSFYLHHCEDHQANLQKASALLPPGGRLYVFDRVAEDQSALNEFRAFWQREYREAHEWVEDYPNLCCRPRLIEAAASAELQCVRHAVSPYDKRQGIARFPKTLMEFQRPTPSSSPSNVVT